METLVGRLIAIVIGLLLPGCGWSAVWVAEHEWNECWEEFYSDWLQNEVTVDTIEPIPFRFDCADLVYSLRAIFARENRLPFIATDNAGNRYGHFSTQWDHIATDIDWKQDKRFHSFLIDMCRDYLSTRTLHHDTYPIALRPNRIKPGIIIYEDRIAAHAATIGQIDRRTPLPVLYYEAFIPGQRHITVSTKTTVQLYPPDIDRSHSGIVYWKQPIFQNGQWMYLPEEEYDGFSLEQYAVDFAYRDKLFGILNRLAYESIHHKPFIDEMAAYQVFQPVLALFQKRLELLSRHASDYPESYEIDHEIFQQLDILWQTIHGFAIPRPIFNQQFGVFALKIFPNEPTVPALVVLDAFMCKYPSSKPSPSLMNRWGIEFDKRSRQWNLKETARDQ